jgi:hypothetical protein
LFQEITMRVVSISGDASTGHTWVREQPSGRKIEGITGIQLTIEEGKELHCDLLIKSDSGVRHERVQVEYLSLQK